MTQIDDATVRRLVEQVLQHVQSGWGNRVAPTAGQTAQPAISGEQRTAPAGRRMPPPARINTSAPAALGRLGQFTDVNDAVAAAVTAQRALMRRSLAQREQICDLVRSICVAQAEELGRIEFEETKIGHLAHKAAKLVLAARIATGVSALRTECFSGDHGITLEEHAPWGVIGALTPVTHSLPTVAVNAVQMIAAGNSVVFNPHPGGKKIAALGARLFNQAIYDNFGIDNLICVIAEPTLESAEAIFHHPDVRMLCITGGPGAVAAAMKSGKRAVCAGPGNPPVVVDASADIENAARCIIEGTSFDNNLLCLSEKEAFVEAAVYEPLMKAMSAAGAYRLSREQVDQLAKICLESPKDGRGHWLAKRQFVGAEPQELARQIGLNVPADCRMLFGPADSEHPFVQAEQMMPFLPVVKCDTFEQCVEQAKDAEHGFRHTSVIHSRLVDHMTHMGKELDTTLYVKNGPSLAGNGAGGEGYASYSIACTTGEGITTPMTFTRFRRCTMVDNLRII
ncbi:MAG: aldehyde dehydrogenase EutE [Phycisphaerae bacterium]|nr:aldehyde dehydrogenase EutE [Phycisphaerae bacterium]